MLLIRTTSLSRRFYIVVSKEFRDAFGSSLSVCGIMFWSTFLRQRRMEYFMAVLRPGPVYERGLGNHSLWLQPRKTVLTRDFTYPDGLRRLLRLVHDKILNSDVKTKLSHHLRQLNSVNLKSQPHSELSSFPVRWPEHQLITIVWRWTGGGFIESFRTF